MTEKGLIIYASYINHFPLQISDTLSMSKLNVCSPLHLFHSPFNCVLW